MCQPSNFVLLILITSLVSHFHHSLKYALSKSKSAYTHESSRHRPCVKKGRETLEGGPAQDIQPLPFDFKLPKPVLDCMLNGPDTEMASDKETRGLVESLVIIVCSGKSDRSSMQLLVREIGFEGLLHQLR